LKALLTIQEIKDMSNPVPDFIARLKTANEARNVMANAKAKMQYPAYRAAFRRLCELEGRNYDDPLHRDFYSMLAAYEELLTEKNGRTTKASRTRQKLTRKDVETCLEDWAISKTPTLGFSLLIENGMLELTAEFLIVKYSDRFSNRAVEAAKVRLQPHMPDASKQV
jgi:hypothetical protein